MSIVPKHANEQFLSLYGGGVPALNGAHLKHLSPEDQRLFSLYGVGPNARPDFPHVVAGFEHFSACQPEAIAAIHGEEEITYGALNARANHLAAELVAMGVVRGDHVGLYLQRGLPMLVGILATLKIGASYVPQHIGVAKDQTLQHIAAVTQMRVVLTESKFRDLMPPLTGIQVVNIDDADGAKNANVSLGAIAADATAFVLFTSGTTGTPNGVQVSHKNIANILLTAPGNLSMAPGKTVGQVLSIAFDMAAWEILGALANGATLLIRGTSIQETVARANIVISTPSILATINHEQCENTEVVAVAGEPCPRPLAEKWGATCAFYNSCGPTETTIINTAARFKPEDAVLSIGSPTPNNTVYILDPQNQPLPIGEIGEMWAGGDCVSKGYLANDALTDDRFVDDPFLGGGRKMFRTRDLGRWTKDGQLEHFGRVDDQVKIRGFRVELDGVASGLEAASGCVRAVALKLDSRTLVGFVSPANVCPIEAQEMVARKLPYYAVPEVVVALEDLPKTPRGKIDKTQLLELAQKQVDTAQAMGAAK